MLAVPPHPASVALAPKPVHDRLTLAAVIAAAILLPGFPLTGVCAESLFAASSPSAPIEMRRPADFVDLKAVAPSVALEIRYAGYHNFVGHPVPGYVLGKCLLTRPAAEAIARVQRQLSDFGFSLKLYDCYRPQRAVDYFVKWARDPSDAAMKREFYPQVGKADLLREGYVASPSSHSRGSTVDLTIVPLPIPAQVPYTPGLSLASCYAPSAVRFVDASLDMGTGYDCFDPQAHIHAPGLSAAQRANRMLLATLMDTAEFAAYPYEWWHFTLRNEPYPATCFDFPVK
jgi:D-alanyl-D-alanine dipeptidase